MSSPASRRLIYAPPRERAKMKFVRAAGRNEPDARHTRGAGRPHQAHSVSAVQPPRPSAVAPTADHASSTNRDRADLSFKPGRRTERRESRTTGMNRREQPKLSTRVPSLSRLVRRCGREYKLQLVTTPGSRGHRCRQAPSRRRSRTVSINGRGSKSARSSAQTTAARRMSDGSSDAIVSSSRGGSAPP